MNNISRALFIWTLFFFSISCSKKNHSHHNHSPSLNNGENQRNHQTKIHYTCSMHPQVKKDKPGKCPICHMNLTKIESDLQPEQAPHQRPHAKEIWRCKDYPDVTSEISGICPIDGSPMIREAKGEMADQVVAKVKLRSAQMKHFFPEYFPVSTMKMIKNIRLLGSVLQSEEKESSIPARIGGRVEKVYVKSTGSLVKKGDPVVDLYSPKLITAGEEYLLARQSYGKTPSREFKDMLNQSEERLNLWGIKRFQYHRWYQNKKVPKKITIYSNTTGIVRKRNATLGKYFKEGQNFFELSDLADVWIEMDVYEHDSSIIKLGQKVGLEFTALPGEMLTGEIDFIAPVLDQKSRTLKVRATIKNTSGKLKPGMIANATLKVEIDGKPLVVPRSAIIDTGKRKVVWVKVTNKKFQAKTISAGYESEGYVEVKNGLVEGEKVVMEGNFLLDAQAQLFGGYEDMKPASHESH